MPPLGNNIDFSNDVEFSKLLLRSDDVDLATASLELARDSDPQLNFAQTLGWIDQCVEELSGPIARAKSEQDMLEALAACLSGTHGLTGSAEAYQSPDGSYLPDVIRTGHGIPISLSVIYIAVAERLQIPLRGVAAPAHFLCRLDAPGGPLFLDAFSSGRVMPVGECTDWLGQLCDIDPSQVSSMLEPAPPRLIILRMLNNLKALFLDRQTWRPALPVQQRLSLLEPTSYAQRRDLALVTLKAGHPDQALGMLQSCLKTAPEDDSAVLCKLVEQAQSALAGWN